PARLLTQLPTTLKAAQATHVCCRFGCNPPARWSNLSFPAVPSCVCYLAVTWPGSVLSSLFWETCRAEPACGRQTLVLPRSGGHASGFCRTLHPCRDSSGGLTALLSLVRRSASWCR